MLKRFFTLSFTGKLFLLLLFFSIISTFILQSYISAITESSLYKMQGEKAKIQAKALAVLPQLIEYVKTNQTTKIRELIHSIYTQSDADYIVIGDSHANRLFHTKNAPLNMPMVGGDNEQVLKGKTITTIKTGFLGTSLRAKAPIFDENQKVIGIVSVGYMLDHIAALHKQQQLPIIILCIGFLIALFLFSWFLSYMIKRQMFDLEPKDIALLVKTQNAIMESIFEGIIAIDNQYKIININHAARHLLGLHQSVKQLINTELNQYIASTKIIYDDNNKYEDIHDQVCYFNDKMVIINRIRILIDKQLCGWVITFRSFDEVNLLSQQLTQINQYVDNLRTLRHEHLNWMATLSGLIHMQRYEEAEKFIALHSADNQKVLDFVTERISYPSIGGLLIGKYSKSHEMNVNLTFDPAMQLTTLPPMLSETELMSIIGNLLDNAFNACVKQSKGDKSVHLYINDESDEIVIEVSDQGCGIDETIRDTIFDQGVTSQDPAEHGIGLHLVETYIQKAQGYITVENNQPYGTIFSIFIPKSC